VRKARTDFFDRDSVVIIGEITGPGLFLLIYMKIIATPAEVVFLGSFSRASVKGV